MQYEERELREEQALDIAKKMMVAARTAPKGKGIDIVEVCTLTGEDKDRLAEQMEVYAEKLGFKFFLRDANNVRQALAVVLIGTKSQIMGLNCAHCGYATCAEKPEAAPCALNSIDVGIALGSAASIAADNRVDSRILFSAGLVAEKMQLMGEDVKQVHAIPLSISSKSPFFDRAHAK